MTIYILICIVSVVLGVIIGRLFGDSDVFKSNKDLDSTIANLIVPVVIALFLVALFIGEFFFDKTWLTEALIHTIIGFLAGWYSQIINSLFLQRKKENDNKEGTQ